MTRQRHAYGSVKAACLLALVGAACHAPRPLADPIPGIPATQQRSIVQSDFGPDWPLIPDHATVACDADVLAVRADGTTYALNDAAAARGFAPAVSVVQWEHSRPPTNPLPTMRQGEREDTFGASAACRRSPLPDACRRELLERKKISERDLQQIEAEGYERLWPPTPPRRQRLDAITEAARALCLK